MQSQLDIDQRDALTSVYNGLGSSCFSSSDVFRFFHFCEFFFLQDACRGVRQWIALV